MTRVATSCLLAAGMAGCVGTPATDLNGLRRGMRIEASGVASGGELQISKVERVPRTESDKASKAEILAPVSRADSASIDVLSSSFAIVESTEFETLDRKESAPYVPSTGDWLRLKVRQKRDGGHRVRTVRAAEARDRFKLIGEVTDLDIDDRIVSIGGIRMPLTQNVQLPEGPQNDDPIRLFLMDDQKSVPLSIAIGDSVRLGGQLSLEHEWNDEFDLDYRKSSDRTKPSAGGKIDVLWALDDYGSYAFAEVTAGRSDRYSQNRPTRINETLQVTRGFVSMRLSDNVQVLAGRQDFDEGREWLHDEVLDGVRGIWRLQDWRIEGAAAVGRDVLAETNVEQDWGMFLGRVSYAVSEDWNVHAYVMQRTDETPVGFEPLYVGVQSQDEPRYGVGHWLEAALARGDAGTQSVRGTGVDVGVTYSFKHDWRPTFAAGYALGSGRTATEPDVGFRQSGFQDNTGKLGGVTSVRYYGELVDPELANLSVTTLSFACRPFRNASVSLLLHGYRQDVAATTLVDTSLRAAPNGLRRDLGRELDLVLAYRIARRLTIECVLGRFEPGDAFDGDTAATIFAFTSRFSF